MDFLRPGLKTGVGNGIFGLKLSLDFNFNEYPARGPGQVLQTAQVSKIDKHGFKISRVNLEKKK